MAKVKAPSEEEKLRKILEKNTFFLNAPRFEDQWEKEVSSIVDLLLLLKRDLEGKNTEEKKTYLATEKGRAFVRKVEHLKRL